MGRVPLIDPATTPAVAPLAGRIRAQRGGKLLNLYATLLHSPAFAEGWLGLLTAVRQHSSLQPSIRELIILRVAQLNGAAYEFAVHRPLALQAGVTQEQVDVLHDWPGTNAFAERERAVLQLTDTMTRSVQVDDAVFQPLRAWFSHQQLVELSVTVAAYNMVSRFLEAMQVEHDDGHHP